LLKSRLEIDSSSQGSMQTTLAERGASSIRPISPKNSPGPRMLSMTSLPSASLIITLSRPEITRYSESVGSPAAITMAPRGKLLRTTIVASVRS
jgi:hypothetical protein